MPLNAQPPGLLSGSHRRRARGTRDGVRVGALEREAAEYAQEGYTGLDFLGCPNTVGA